jgi:hypothetical protein
MLLLLIILILLFGAEVATMAIATTAPEEASCRWYSSWL